MKQATLNNVKNEFKPDKLTATALELSKVPAGGGRASPSGLLQSPHLPITEGGDSERNKL